MGKLTKAQIDEIAKLRKEGYTQKEVAERLHVHPRTVRKYDPSRHDRSEERSVENRLSALEGVIKTCWDYIDLLYFAIVRSPICNSLEKETYGCPRCSGKLKYDEEKVTHICADCGHKYPLLEHLCYSCLSQEPMDYVEEIDNWVCRKCGAKRYIPKRR